MIQQASGVTDENLGRKTNAVSGIAIERRQDQGSLSTTHYFDNERLAFQIQGEKKLSLVEQFMTEQKAFRITNMRGTPEYVTVNDGLPENDIVRCKADYVISEADWRSTMRQAATAELMDLMVKLAPVNPQLAMAMLDLVVESSDVPNREEIVRRIRELTGMRDPDAAEPTPEEIGRAQQAQDKAALEKAGAEASVRKIAAEAVRAEMQAMKEQALAVRANVASLGGPKRGGLDIAADAMTRPELAPVVDEVMRDLGFVGRGEKEHEAELAARVQVAQQVQAEQQQQQAQAEQPGLPPGPPTQDQQPQPDTAPVAIPSAEGVNP
ncbi:MAG: portal protein, partial [Xanthobacteraceae bacterium]|nr:portal protein [Xanthobacteraceae bacterium]